MMAERRGLMLVSLAAVAALGLGLGSSARLSYHEAIVGQGAREMLARGDGLIPTIGGVPWLEKPPLAHWLVAGLGAVLGGVDETVARLPSALAALGLALALAWWAMRRFGVRVGVLAGLIQATSAWWVTRGRLADADMLLAALVTGAVVAFDGLRGPSPSRRWASLGFFVLLGATALVKGIGFGGALVLAAAGAVWVWDRDGAGASRLIKSPVGIVLALLIALAWPLLVLARYPEAGSVWWGHVGGRLGVGADAPRFAGESWAEYLTFPLVGLLPWTPLVVIGAIGSWRRARAERFGADRLLWCWAIVPSFLVSLSSARNGHYLLPMLPPLGVWGALGLERVREFRFTSCRLRKGKAGGIPRGLGFVAVALLWGLGYALVGPVVDGKGKGGEWGWYEDISKRIGERTPVVLLYDAPDRPDRWDRATYPTPFGDVPPDLAVRLFYLGPRRAVTWCAGTKGLEAALRAEGARYVIGRARDLDEATIVARGPGYREDRTFCVAESGREPATLAR